MVEKDSGFYTALTCYRGDVHGVMIFVFYFKLVNTLGIFSASIPSEHNMYTHLFYPKLFNCYHQLLPISSYLHLCFDVASGIAVRLTGTFKNSNNYHYQTIRVNVNELKVIQLGLSLANKDGQVPEGCCTWQFHFNFNVKYVFQFTTYMLLFYVDVIHFYFIFSD